MSLHEPVSIAVHGLLRRPPAAGVPVAVVGAGIIGLAAVAAVRHLFPENEVTVVARHEHQAEAARACGADHVVIGAGDNSHFEQLAPLAGARVTGRGARAMLAGGFPYVIEAVGFASSVSESLRLVDNWGTVLLLGAAGVSEVDLTPVWWKEAELVGAVNHNVDVGPGGDAHSVDRALEVLAAGGLPHEVVVTHEYPLVAVRDAVTAATDKRASRAIKVVFRPDHP
jgi:threonine dehydrogenase-like Zn-dependent dehydrogenase